MLKRIASALAVATVAGFLASGTAVADDGPSTTHSEGRYAGQAAYNMGGPYGITYSGAHAGGHQDGSSLDGVFSSGHHGYDG
ncbi:hypothetical protein GCM10010277_43080 [Streptomyces longisporoflavus]|uniref:hypothetical protein n=1 Tax=Streptomyces longisporoflavus TaxID=28044 RepID=UPI00167DCE67|nr:hypothetical protein [Streptomyces longisporoflavus]GGV49331.1 hypothetical protein GCM10010277_43080 [Streptomyces longisporoflavus]